MGGEAGRSAPLLGDGGLGVKLNQCNFGRFKPGIDLHSILRDPHGVRGVGMPQLEQSGLAEET